MSITLNVSDILEPQLMYQDGGYINYSPFYRFTKFREGTWDLNLRSANKTREIPISGIKLLSSLKPNEKMISGRERRQRLLISGYKLLDVSALASFLMKKNQGRIPDGWKGQQGKPACITFDGNQYVRKIDGVEYVFFLCWRGNRWTWSYRRIDHMFGANDYSAVLPI